MTATVRSPSLTQHHLLSVSSFPQDDNHPICVLMEEAVHLDIQAAIVPHDLQASQLSHELDLWHRESPLLYQALSHQLPSLACFSADFHLPRVHLCKTIIA